MTPEEKNKLDELVMRAFTLAYELGTNLDDLHKQFRELRFNTKDRDLEAALINVEHAFFMVAQSINILKEQTRNALIPARKAQTREGK